MRRLALLLLLLAAPAHALTLTAPNARLYNTTVNGDLTIAATADSAIVQGCTITGSLSVQGADGVRIDNNWIGGKFINLNKWKLLRSKDVSFTNNTAPNLGKGVTGVQSHIIECWDDDGTRWVNNKFTVTIEAGLDPSVGGEWHFDSRNRWSADNKITFDLKRTCYAVWRWRSDVGGTTGVTNGCYNNRFTRDTIIVTGMSGKLLPSSSSTCNGTLAGCVGQWDATMDQCVITAPGCEIAWQGGMTGWTITNSKITATPAIHAFDIHRSRVQGCAITGDVRWTDEYQRPLWKAGDMVFCDNVVVGNVTTAPALAAVPGAYVTTCAAPVPIPPSPITDLATTDGNAKPLQWTSTGGAAYACDQSTTVGFLPQYTKSVTIRSDKDTSAVALKPGPAGTKEYGWVSVPYTGRGVFYRVYVVGADGQRSAPSNIVNKIERPWWTLPLATAVLVVMGGATAMYAWQRKRADAPPDA